MLYIFYGEEDFIINKQIENIYKRLSISKESIVKKSFADVQLFDFLNEVEQSNLFSSANFIVGTSFELFLNKKQQNKNAQINRLIEFSKQGIDSTLILICNKAKLPKNTFIKKLGKFSQVIECKKLNRAETNKIIAKAFENRNIKISQTLLDYFVKRSGKNIRGLISEIDKLSLFQGKITQEIIDQLIEPALESNIFSLIDSILSKDLKSSMQKYEELINHGTSPLAVLTLVGNELALMSALVSSEDKSISSSTIAAIFKKPAFAVSKAYKKIISYDKKSILKLIDSIAKIEKEYKTGKISQNIFIQFFIYKIIKGES